MRILLVSQYFWPETFRINDLAESLSGCGNKVTVLTGKPNYPQGKIYKGYSFWGYSKEVYKGIEVIRVPLIPRGNSSGIRLAINYLSFVLFSCIYILFHKRQYDVSLTFAISPITQVYAALLHKKLYGSRVFLWVQDLWPESVNAAGKISSSFVYRLLIKIVKNIYNHVDHILVQSEAFYSSILQKGVEAEKISYIPNWAEDLFLDENMIDGNKYKEIIPQGFIVMFAGNIGEAQDFDSIVKAAIKTKNILDIKWVIIGDGRKRKDLEKQIQKYGLEETIYLLGKFPIEEMPSLFFWANVMLVSLKDAEIFSLTIPSKIQSYMAFGKPIVSMMNGIGNSIIREADCGYVASSGDYERLAENVILAYHSNQDTLDIKGKNGRDFYKKKFSKASVIERLLLHFN